MAARVVCPAVATKARIMQMSRERYENRIDPAICNLVTSEIFNNLPLIGEKLKLSRYFGFQYVLCGGFLVARNDQVCSSVWGHLPTLANLHENHIIYHTIQLNILKGNNSTNTVEWSSSLKYKAP